MVNVCQGKMNQNLKIDTVARSSLILLLNRDQYMYHYQSIYICLPNVLIYRFDSIYICLSDSLVICLSVNLSVYNCSFPFCKYRFLYSDEVQIGPETVMTTLYTAKKYAVPALEAHCVEFLKKNLRADNAFMLLTQVITGACVRFHVRTGTDISNATFVSSLFSRPS